MPKSPATSRQGKGRSGRPRAEKRLVNKLDEVAEAGDKDDFVQETGRSKRRISSWLMTATKKPVKNMARAMLVWKIWARLTSDAPPGSRADIAGNGDPVAKSIQDQARRITDIQEMPCIKICLLFKYHNFTLLITNIPIDFH